MSFTESIVAERAFASASDPQFRADRESLATGGGTSQTSVERADGGQTQKASLVTATVALATMLFLAPVLGLLPNAVLAAVAVGYSIGLIQPAEIQSARAVVRQYQERFADAPARSPAGSAAPE